MPYSLLVPVSLRYRIGVWSGDCSSNGMIERFLFSIMGALLLATMAGFFFFVPALPLLLAVAMLIALAVMFFFGLYVGRNLDRRARAARALTRIASHKQAV